MLQFNKSQTTNTNAVYLDSIPSGSILELIIEASQSYNRNGYDFEASVVSAPTQYNHWLLFQNSGSVVPSASGQYDIKLWSGFIDPDLTWGEFAQLWKDANILWSAGAIITKEELLYEDRAFISGSDSETITQYVSPNENGTYITYNG